MTAVRDSRPFWRVRTWDCLQGESSSPRNTMVGYDEKTFHEQGDAYAEDNCQSNSFYFLKDVVGSLSKLNRQNFSNS